MAASASGASSRRSNAKTVPAGTATASSSRSAPARRPRPAHAPSSPIRVAMAATSAPVARAAPSIFSGARGQSGVSAARTDPKRPGSSASSTRRSATSMSGRDASTIRDAAAATVPGSVTGSSRSAMVGRLRAAARSRTCPNGQQDRPSGQAARGPALGSLYGMTTQTIPQTMQAVRIGAYGGAEVLELGDVPTPEAVPGRVLVRVQATSINPGEIAIRQGALAEIFPMDLPFGQGSDIAGEVAEDAEGFRAGDRVFGWTDERAAQAEYVAVPAGQLAPIPEGVTLEQAASLHVVGATAVAAVGVLALQPDETVVISAAAGGVGVLATQLAARTGATVIALASEPNHDWLRDHGAVPVAHGEGVADRIRAAAPNGVDAFLDLFGGGYVALALDELGVAPERVNTIADFPAVSQRGVHGAG